MSELVDITGKKRNFQSQESQDDSNISCSSTPILKKPKKPFPENRLRADSIYSGYYSDLYSQFELTWIAALHGYTDDCGKQQKNKMKKQAKAAYYLWKEQKNAGDEHLPPEMQSFIQSKEQLWLTY